MKLFDIYIIYQDGRNIYHKNFAPTSLDSSVISGFLSALNDFAKEALPSEGMLKVIEKGNIKVIFKHGKKIHMVLITEVNDKNEIIYLNNRLIELTEKIETKYSDKIEDWGGAVEDFPGIEELVYEHFREASRLCSPPSGKELIERKDFYLYRTDEDGINVYETFYRASWGFTAFLEKYKIQVTIVDQLLEKLKSTYLSFNEVKNEFNLEEETLIRILRNLALRGILNVCA
jgi:hypothetical protein